MKINLITGAYAHRTQPDYNVRKVIVRRNRWDNYGLFIGSRKVLDGADRERLMDRARELYPNAKIFLKID